MKFTPLLPISPQLGVTLIVPAFDLASQKLPPGPSMATHCDSCHAAARQVARLLEIRHTGSGKPSELLGVGSTDDGESIKPLATFGTVADISDRMARCLSCQDLHFEVMRWAALDDWEPKAHLLVGIHIRSAIDRRLQPMLLTVEAWDPSTVDTPERDSSESYFVNLQPLDEGGPSDPRGRIIDRHSADLDLVKEWIQVCEEHHGDICKPTSLSKRLPTEACPSRILLVDLENSCLCFSALEEHYIALSYVWGLAETLRTTTANLSHHLEPGSLDFRHKQVAIPVTIRDFMSLAFRMGFRYVWVDSLCVIQDGPELREQLGGMAAIFASAHLTIVAEGPTADFGMWNLC